MSKRSDTKTTRRRFLTAAAAGGAVIAMPQVSRAQTAVTVIFIVVGMASTGKPEAQASLMPPVVQKHELASPFEVRQQLLKMLGERELSQRVSLQVVNGQVALNGDVSQDDVELVARMLSRFGEQFDSAVPVISRVRR